MSLPKPKTPVMNSTVARLRSLGSSLDSPSVKVPASPMMKRLGYGTGVNVYMMKRPAKNEMPRSPWAVKRLNNYGKKHKERIMERMKNEITALKQFNHLNLIAFRAEYHAQATWYYLLVSSVNLHFGT